jgi:uncharacterized membrane protein YphA (DoxX/SURF4 family)
MFRNLSTGLFARTAALAPAIQSMIAIVTGHMSQEFEGFVERVR